MNRQLKFRVWSKILERFLSKEEYCFDFDGKLIWVDITDPEKQVVQLIAVPEQNYIVQQSTGLTDKNGKEIYEGDIVRTTGRGLYKILSDGQPEYTHGIIKFFCSAWKICQKDIGASDVGNYTCCDGGHDEDSLEVLGNIFENSELL